MCIFIGNTNYFWIYFIEKILILHKNRKYKLDVLLKYIIQILLTGLFFIKIQKLTNNKINWNTIYKFSIKLQKI